MADGQHFVVLALLLAYALSQTNAVCGTTNSDAISNGHSAQTGADGFTLTADVATSYYLSEHLTFTLNVPSGGDQWVAFEFSARNSTGKLEGSWDTTKTILVPSGTATASHLLCDTTNTLSFHLVSGATTPTFTTGHGSVQVTWIAPASSTYGSISFFAAVSIDSITWFNVNGPLLPYLAPQGKCVNPKTGNTTWTPHPVCNGHGICELNNTCVCNGTWTGAGCFIDTTCNSGYAGKPGHCVACAAGTYKTGVGAIATNVTDDAFFAGLLTNNLAGISLVTGTLTVSGAPHTRLIVHGDAVFSGGAPSGTFDNGTISVTTKQGRDAVFAVDQAKDFLGDMKNRHLPVVQSILFDGGVVLPGIYFSNNITVSHTVTLSGPYGSQWIFIGGSINFLSKSKVVMAGGADACNVAWIPAEDISFRRNSTVSGMIFSASPSFLFTIHRDVTIMGKVLSDSGATITIPDSGGTVTINPPTGCTAFGSLTYDTTKCTRCRDTFGLLPLDLAGKYALLSGSIIGVTTAATVSGDIGAVTAPSPADYDQVAGTFHSTDDADVTAALANATAAARSLFYIRCTFVAGGGLSDIHLTPGNYCFDGVLPVAGQITFDGLGNPLSVWRIIASGNINFGVLAGSPPGSGSGFSSLYAAGSDNILINGALNSNIFWIAAFNVFIAADTTVNGNIISLSSSLASIETSYPDLVDSGGVTTGNNVHVTGSIISLGSINLGEANVIGDIAVPQHYINPARFTSPGAAISSANCSVSGSLCGTGRSYSAGSCPLCPRGTYKSITGDQDCSLCDVAHTTPSTGSTSVASCSVPLCPPGQFGDPTGLNCQECPVASYKPTYGPQTCTPCPVGFNTTGNGRALFSSCSVAINCPAGYFSSTGKGPCHTCGLGTYYNATGGHGPCHQCPTGTYSTTIASPAISSCAPVTGLPAGDDLCSQFHFKQELCAVRFDIEGCVFNTTTGVCAKKNCTYFTDLASCNIVRTCRWYDPTGFNPGSAKCNDYVPSSSTAYSICNTIDSGYGTTYLGFDAYALACQAQPMCEYLCTTNHCVVERNIVATTPDVTYAECIQDGLAVWVQNVADCYDPANPSHVFIGYDDPAFNNFTCPAGACIPKGRHNPTLYCLQETLEDCNAAANDNSCVWSVPLGRCLATENPLAYSLSCNFCAFSTRYLQHFWDVTIPTIGPATCTTPDCVLATDCPLKSHCRVHAGSCIADDAYLCPLLVSQYECTVTPGGGECALYNATAICRSSLFPPTGWPAYSGISPNAQNATVVDSNKGNANVPTHFNFIVNLHGFSFDPTGGILTFYLNAPLNWNPGNPLEVLVKIGRGGYPGLGYNFDLSSISGVTSVPVTSPDFKHLATYIAANHDLPPVCSGSCGAGLTQDVYDALNPTGIAKSIILIPDPYNGPTLQYKIQLNIGTILTAGANAGVTGTHVSNPNAVPVSGVLVASTTLTIPVTAIWRSAAGSTPVTSTLNVVVNDFGVAQVSVAGQVGYGITVTVNAVSLTSTGCSAGQVAETASISMMYATHSPDQLWLGPLHIQDLTMLTNCYSATLSNFQAPVCIAGAGGLEICTSTVDINVPCRSTTLSSNAFISCPALLDPSFDGQYTIQVTPWYCESTGVGKISSCSGQTLLQGQRHDRVETEILLPADNSTVAVIFIEEAPSSSTTTLSAGAIAGIVVAGVVFMVFLGVVIGLVATTTANPYSSVRTSEPRPRLGRAR